MDINRGALAGEVAGTYENVAMMTITMDWRF